MVCNQQFNSQAKEYVTNFISHPRGYVSDHQRSWMQPHIR